MNIYKHELRIRLRSVIIWSLSVMALLFVFISISAKFTEKAGLMNELLANYPPELLMAFGMAEMDFSSILGYFGLIFLFCQICLGIQAANYGFGLVSIEESEFTADFLLAKPVKRSAILTSKLLAAFTSLTITNAVVWASSFFFLAVYDKGTGYDVKTLMILLATIPAFQLVFLGLGVVISLMVKRVRSVTPFSMALVFGTYTFNAFSGMLGEKSLDLLTPFKHFDPNFIVKNANWDWPLVAISVGVIIVSFPASYWLYSRRNIPSAT
jgi:ABC-2 type transport system permease protein